VIDGDGLLDAVDWNSAVQAVIDSGWCRVPEAISARQADRLIRAATGAWRPLPHNEGGGTVYQAGFAAFSILESSGLLVRGMAQSLKRCLMNAVPAGCPELPAFNEVSWTRYPEGAGHITGHRDPPGCGGVIAVLTLAGAATFYIGPSRDRSTDSWQTSRGDLVILRGFGWPVTGARCVVHGVEPPPAGERMIMTFRHNRGGAGADYFSSR
jgi:hypothetical protein